MIERGGGKTVRVRLKPATELPALYATNFSVQGTDHEIVITFYEARPPVIIGTPEEQAAKWKQLGEVEAVPLARIVMAATRLPEFFQVLQEGFVKRSPEPSTSEVER